MAELRDEISRLLDHHPELESVIEELLTCEEPWTFDDATCDSGQFGELVSQDAVESFEDGYRFTDTEQVRRAIQEGQEATEDHKSADESEGSVAETRNGTRDADQSLTARVRAVEKSVQRVTGARASFLLTLLTTLGFLGVMRAITYRSVFRDKHVVLPGNDPYHFRYWIDQLLVESPGLFDFAAIGDVLGGRVTSYPLTYVIGWWLTRLVEGTPATSGDALAWLPVLATLVVGILLAWIALAVTEDERVAVLSVLTFAVAPAHALYSGIGFADHNPIDYVWLTLMVATLVWLARDSERTAPLARIRRVTPWAVAVVFGLACAAAMLTWSGAPLLLLGVVLYAVLRPASEVRSDRSPLITSLPLIGGLAVATLVTHLFHTTAGWQEPAAVYAPGIVLFGVVGVAAFAEFVDRKGGTPSWVLGGSIAVGFVGLVSTFVVAPTVFDRLADRFLDSLLGRTGAAETQSLLTPEFGIEFNPLQYFGLLLLFALPALWFVTRACARRHEPRWLVIVSYAWANLGLSLIQVRFTGELSPFVALLAGVGLLWMLSEVKLCRPLGCFGSRNPRPLQLRGGVRDINQAVYLSFALVVVLTVGIMFTAGILNTIAIDDEQYDAAEWIAEDSGGQDGYVLSDWGPNRMYNYLSWGYADSYGFAERYYAPFVASENPDNWHSWLTDPQDSLLLGHGYDRGAKIPEFRPDGRVSRPSSRFGTYPEHIDYIVFDQKRTGEFPVQAWINAVGQYQFVYVTPKDRILVFKPVEGAVVSGKTQPNTTVELTTDIRVTGIEITYTREVTTDENGTFSIRVAYPGEYQLSTGLAVNISESEIHNGSEVHIEAKRQS